MTTDYQTKKFYNDQTMVETYFDQSAYQNSKKPTEQFFNGILNQNFNCDKNDIANSGQETRSIAYNDPIFTTDYQKRIRFLVNMLYMIAGGLFTTFVLWVLK